MVQSSRGNNRFLQRLAAGLIIGDGAMGTLLYNRGIPLGHSFEALNLSRPELVEAVHRDYTAAGAQLLESNTFAANRLALGPLGLDGRVAEINAAGVRLARKAAGIDRLVAGAVGPLPPAKGQTAELSLVEQRSLFSEQMTALAEAGADLFILETFAVIEELELALQVAADLDLPAVAQMAFFEEGRTRHGMTAEEVARRLSAVGAAVVGANCGSGPRELLTVLQRMATVTDRPLSGFANSGFPQYANGRYIYLATPDYFATMGREMVAAGACLVGGCCGTTPEHIQALSMSLKDLHPIERPAPIIVVTEQPVVAEPALAKRTFLADWGRRPVVTVELGPPKGLDCRKVLRGAEALAKAGADAISLTENPLARIRMGNIALASQIQQQADIEVIIHITGRDRNLIGLHSELLGAHLLGIRNVLAITGDPVAIGGEAGASSVFDLNSVGILQLLSSLNKGTTLLGAELGGTTQMLAGAAFNPNVADMSGQIRRMEKKIEAGARFVETQPVYSAEVMLEMLERLAPLNIPVLIGLMPLVSERNAEFLHNEVPGISLPDEVRRRMAGTSGPAGVSAGMTIARELIDAGRQAAGGYTLMPPFGKVELALELLRYIRG
ncbi:MAG: bifunctional homocysteine S-methyltransferase/methylenetetrahydrofolate reductase [Desulfuromonadales bacterium C00003094]|jgi:homocysteine S-methyltransferase|nr:MAG: bifunctional homocysteine S-methyltransferase/methylenetetrahydrofolate reductase [Desulfuromonadales bacterium C00003094]